MLPAAAHMPATKASFLADQLEFEVSPAVSLRMLFGNDRQHKPLGGGHLSVSLKM